MNNKYFDSNEALFNVYSIIVSIDINSIRKLIISCNRIYNELDKLKDDIIDTVIGLDNITDTTIFNLPPYENIESSCNQMVYWIERIENFFEYLFGIVDKIYKDDKIALYELEKYLPDIKELKQEASLQSRVALVRKPLLGKDLKEDYTEVSTLLVESINKVRNLKSLCTIYIDLANSFIASNKKSVSVNDLDEFTKIRISNVDKEYKLAMYSDQFIVFCHKKIIEKYKIYNKLLLEYKNQLKKGR